MTGDLAIDRVGEDHYARTLALVARAADQAGNLNTIKRSVGPIEITVFV